MKKLVSMGLMAAVAAVLLWSASARAQNPPGEPPADEPGLTPPDTGSTVQPGSTAQPLTLDEVIGKLQANYASITTYEVDFNQALFSTSQGRVISKGSGSVMYKKPGKMKWIYKAPEEHWFITDGNTVYDYAPKDKEAYVLPLRDATIKSFLLGLGDVRKDFEVSFKDGKALTPSGLYQVNLVPRDQADREAIGTITIYISPALNYMVQFTEMTDALGNHNQIKFINMRLNNPLGDDLFKFNPPPGVKVIQAKDMAPQAPTPPAPK